MLDRISETGEAGAPESVRPFLVAGLARRTGPLFVVLPRSRDAEALASSLSEWVGPGEVALFPAWEVLPGEAMSPTLEVMGRRIDTLLRLSRGELRVVVASVRAFLQRVAHPKEEQVTIREGTSVSPDELAERLVAFGYDRNYLVERPGEFSVRGGIFDVYPPSRNTPVRIDFFGDEVSDLREFSISSQRSGDKVETLEVLPASELRLTPKIRERAAVLAQTMEEGTQRREDLERISAGAAFAGMEMYLAILSDDLELPIEFLPPEGSLVVCDPKLCVDRSSEFLEQAREWGTEDTRDLFAEFDLAAGQAPTIELWAFRRAEEGVDLEVTGWDELIGRPDRLAHELNRLRAAGATVAIGAGRAANRAREVLSENGLGLTVGAAQPGAAATITDAAIDKGFALRWDAESPVVLALVGEADLFGRRRIVAAPPEAPARASALLLELAPGDFVVHEIYGVGRYHGMVTREIAGISRDYLIISYHGEDRLYLPTEQLEAITKYTGGETPRLNRLGSAEWEKAKSRARRAVADIAGELIVLYSKRMNSPGYEFSPDTPWQSELEASFPYVETPDQARAIEEVKGDMEKPIPMDRVICGDVGYGKTEVGVRAAFKAVQDSKQVAVLVPTTILAQQHTQTFTDRFAGYPIKVSQLSRFLSQSEQAQALENLATGKLDVVIGTHRLLQPDVKFHELGLLIVDEEQRFGVKHKETIKKFREMVDVLTLTATPIPRTLEMSITGIRDLSIMDTPPIDRRPVLTYVGEADERMVIAAIRRELARDGQVFYVHNRVRSIKGVARKIAGLVPGARIEIAHGQMSEAELERVMIDVWDGKIDVLVCTTIIESGLDIPAMNTLIVERADLLGLAQLYQLRGRVGRARERAYAYFFYPHEAVLTDEAHERLKILSEFTELGSGFKIALRDLEIRGAGNLLGAEQSGHIAAVGFDLYVRMMDEAVNQLKGEEPAPKIEVKIDLPIDAFIPPSYIGRESLRMEAYRQIERVRSTDDAAALKEEFEDLYGSVPESVQNLLLVAEVRAFMADRKITEMSVRDGVLKVRPFPALLESQEIRLRRLHPRSTYKQVTDTLLIPAPADDLASWVLNSLRAILA